MNESRKLRVVNCTGEYRKNCVHEVVKRLRKNAKSVTSIYLSDIICL